MVTEKKMKEEIKVVGREKLIFIKTWGIRTQKSYICHD